MRALCNGSFLLRGGGQPTKCIFTGRAEKAAYAAPDAHSAQTRKMVFFLESHQSTAAKTILLMFLIRQVLPRVKTCCVSPRRALWCVDLAGGQVELVGQGVDASVLQADAEEERLLDHAQAQPGAAGRG